MGEKHPQGKWNSFQRLRVSMNESETRKRNVCFVFVFRQKNEYMP